MELVKGIKITDYCDQNSLSTEERLNLFIKVCHAAQHAHQKGIIHRDLKPSNVMITLHDGEAVPKVIDFGIAKATGQGLTEKTLFTRYEQMIGTPAYMSPEQAAMSGLDIDTRTDIYALGVLLYELLTGVTPFDKETLAKVALDEIRRLIQETEPPKPSTRLTQLAKTPHSALSTPHSKEVRGDLDWIVMKALEKDRRRRYETANDFAEDIERHLKHEPVVASPPSTVYRARKFVRRNRVPVAIAASVTLALLAGLSLALVGLQRALNAESSARRERDRAVQAEAEMRRERDRAVQAETDTRGMLEFFDGKQAVDDEVIALLQTGARVARERLGPTNQTTLNFQFSLADSSSRLGAWSTAIEAYRSLIEARPDDPGIWYAGCAVTLAAGVPERSRELQMRLLARFGQTTNVDVAARLAKALLFGPDFTNRLEVAVQWVERAIASKPESPWRQTAKGIAEYRCGHWPETLKWLEQPERNENPQLAGLACCFIAMARQQLGQEAAARQVLERAQHLPRDQLSVGDLGAGGTDWDDWVWMLLAQAEAEQLILGPQAPPPVTAQSLLASRQQWKVVRQLLQEAEAHAKEKQWRDALDVYARAMDHPAFNWRAAEFEFTELSQQYGVVLLRAGDAAKRQQLCESLVASDAGKFFSPFTEKNAKTCLINWQGLPSEVQQSVVKSLREMAKQVPMDTSPFSYWYYFAAGMAEYRSGQSQRALELLKYAKQSKEPVTGEVACRGGAMVFEAMALQELGRAEEARTALAKAEEWLAKPLATRSGANWWDLDICEVALEEARELFGQTSRK
jgi:tetratricopeptide (TPR) repeat protein